MVVVYELEIGKCIYKVLFQAADIIGKEKYNNERTKGKVRQDRGRNFFLFCLSPSFRIAHRPGLAWPGLHSLQFGLRHRRRRAKLAVWLVRQPTGGSAQTSSTVRTVRIVWLASDGELSATCSGQSWLKVSSRKQSEQAADWTGARAHQTECT